MPVHKFVTPGGHMVARCPSCKRMKRAHEFLIGDNPKDPKSWTPRCKRCRLRDEPYSKDVRLAIGMPDDANWGDWSEDVCKSDTCEGGRYTGGYGVCYRCQGSGVQTWLDVARNYWYDTQGEPVSLEYDEGDLQAEVEAEVYLEEMEG